MELFFQKKAGISVEPILLPVAFCLLQVAFVNLPKMANWFDGC